MPSNAPLRLCGFAALREIEKGYRSIIVQLASWAALSASAKSWIFSRVAIGQCSASAEASAITLLRVLYAKVVCELCLLFTSPFSKGLNASSDEHGVGLAGLVAFSGYIIATAMHLLPW